MTKQEELIKCISSMTPEQAQKFMDHPTCKKIMTEYADKKEDAQ